MSDVMVSKTEIEEYFTVLKMSKTNYYHVLRAYDLLRESNGKTTSTDIIQYAQQNNLQKGDVFFGLTCLRMHGFLNMEIVEKNTIPPSVHIHYRLNTKKVEVK